MLVYLETYLVERRIKQRRPPSWLWQVALFLLTVLSFMWGGPLLFKVLPQVGPLYAALVHPEVVLLLTGMIFIHEYGHKWALRMRKIPAVGPIPIPLLGAMVHPGEPLGSAWTELIFALGGPATGIFSLALYGVALWLGNDFLAAMAWLGVFLNFLNAWPIIPLDGGVAVKALLSVIHTKARHAFIILCLGVVMLLGLWLGDLAIFGRAVFLIIGLLGLLDLALGVHFSHRKAKEVVYQTMSLRQLPAGIALYLLVLGGLFASFVVTTLHFVSAEDLVTLFWVR